MGQNLWNSFNALGLAISMLSIQFLAIQYKYVSLMWASAIGTVLFIIVSGYSSYLNFKENTSSTFGKSVPIIWMIIAIGIIFFVVYIFVKYDLNTDHSGKDSILPEIHKQYGCFVNFTDDGECVTPIYRNDSALCFGIAANNTICQGDIREVK